MMNPKESFPAKACPQKLYDGLSALQLERPIGKRCYSIFGEAFSQIIPQFAVQTAEILMLQRLDRLDILQRLKVSHNLLSCHRKHHNPTRDSEVHACSL